MMPVGILLVVFGYAVTYSGVIGLTRGANVGVIESLTPGFVPPVGPTQKEGPKNPGGNLGAPTVGGAVSGFLVPPTERHP